ncbi:hypothetical protein GOODEAATRI_000481 [Goodea atripinnis]|uniref:Uncharacterized protein n=1 Tax=Goodea atripinnis TaxID=208336 RepID=A0ABV0N6P4_9TELE
MKTDESKVMLDWYGAIFASATRTGGVNRSCFIRYHPQNTQVSAVMVKRKYALFHSRVMLIRTQQIRSGLYQGCTVVQLVTLLPCSKSLSALSLHVLLIHVWFLPGYSSVFPCVDW